MSGGGWQSEWHFVDNPYVDNGKTIDDYPAYKLADVNVTLAITQIIDWFRDTPDHKDGVIYKTIMRHYNSEALGKSMALRLLIHFIGDIHQPLHCMNRVNDQFPKGDKGGNEFLLPNHLRSNNLHAVWDAAVYRFHASIKLVILSLIINICV